MKKYIALALVAFFGTAAVSTVFAPADDHKHDHKDGKHQHDGKNHQHGATHAGAGSTAAPAAGQGGATQK